MFRSASRSCSSLPRAGYMLAFLVLAGRAALAAQPVVRLASTDWPPYSGASLPGQGETVALVRHVLARAGYDLRVEFLPWQKAQWAGMKEAGFVGYFPAYRARSRAGTCLFSGELGSSQVGLAIRKDHPVHWSSAESLSRLTLGVVAGYANTEALDKRIVTHRQTVRSAVSDYANLNALLAGQVDAAIIDRNVMAYLLNNTPPLRAERSRVDFGEKILENKTLHVCFRRDDAGRDIREAFDASLAYF